MNHTALENLALRIFETFVRILLNVNLSLNQTLLTFLLCVRQTWMTQLILAVSLRKGVFLNLKGFYYSYTWSYSLSLSWDSLSLMGLICRKLRILTCFRVALLYSLSYLFPLSITFAFMHNF